MPKSKKTTAQEKSSKHSFDIAAHLGEKGRIAFDKVKGKKTWGLYDGDVVPVPFQDMRALANAVSTLDSKVPDLSPRLCKHFGQNFHDMLDFEEAAARWGKTPTKQGWLWEKGDSWDRDEGPGSRGLNTQRLSEITPVDVEWLWPQRVPLGKLTMISGDPDLGKTWVTLDIACRISTGRNFSDFANPFGERRDVLWVSAEDDDADTIRPRIDTLGGDPSRIHSLKFCRATKWNKDSEENVAQDRPLDLSQDIDAIDQWLTAHPLVCLLVLDPIAAFLGKVDSHRNSAVRALLTPLTKLAAKHQVAIIGINHLAKGDGDKAMYKSIGSIAFVAAARSCWLVTADPKEKDRRLFLKVKGNLQSEDVGGLAYRIGPHVEGAIMWEPDPIRTTADETLRTPPTESRAPARADAKKWLEETLKDGPVPAADIWGKAKADNMCKRTVEYAKKEMEIITDKNPGKDGKWVWRLPNAN